MFYAKDPSSEQVSYKVDEDWPIKDIYSKYTTTNPCFCFQNQIASPWLSNHKQGLISPTAPSALYLSFVTLVSGQYMELSSSLSILLSASRAKTSHSYRQIPFVLDAMSILNWLETVLTLPAHIVGMPNQHM